MRLVVTIPEGWQQETRGPNRVISPEPGIELEITLIMPLPEDVAAWSLGAAGRDLPPGVARVEVTSRVESKTDLGYLIGIHDSKGFDAAGALVQVRIHVVYVLVEHCSIVAIRGTDPVRLAARRDELLAVARSGRPEWGIPAGASLTDLLAT